MKYLMFLMLLVPSISNATQEGRSLELVTGGVTYHIIDNGASASFANKLSKDGRLIYTPEVGLKMTHTDGHYNYGSVALFTARNSIGSPVYGGLLSSGLDWSVFNIGLAIGGYIQNDEDFRYKGIQPYSAAGNTNALVPLAGVEANIKLPVSERFFIAFNNLLTPIITNHNLSIGYRFE